MNFCNARNGRHVCGTSLNARRRSVLMFLLCPNRLLLQFSKTVLLSTRVQITAIFYKFGKDTLMQWHDHVVDHMFSNRVDLHIEVRIVVECKLTGKHTCKY